MATNVYKRTCGAAAPVPAAAERPAVLAHRPAMWRRHGGVRRQARNLTTAHSGAAGQCGPACGQRIPALRPFTVALRALPTEPRLDQGCRKSPHIPDAL